VVLRLTFGGPGAPHHLVVFGFSRRLGWTPNEIEAGFWENPPLGESDPRAPAPKNSELRLAAILENEYIATSELNPDKIRLRFKPLRDKMFRRVGEVITEAKTRDKCRTVLDWLAGDTVLRHYHDDDPQLSEEEVREKRRADVSYWCDTVIRQAETEAACQPERRKNPGGLARNGQPECK
jgi:hypothetical protein